MSERGANYAINAFILVTAALIPITPLLAPMPFTSTFYSGGVLVMVYVAANPGLLQGGKAECMSIIRRGPVVPVALLAGAGLMIVDLVQTWLRYSAA
jgi:hypothetical protein